MTVRGVENSYLYKVAQSRTKQEKENPVNGFPAGLAGERGREDEHSIAKSHVDSQTMYAYQRAAAASHVRETGQPELGVAVETAVRGLTYAQCDAVVVDVLGGCTMKAAADVAGQNVYVEVKTEDGETRAYEIDPFQIAGGPKNPIEKTALECWHKKMAEKESDAEEKDLAGGTSVSETEPEEDGDTENGLYVPGAEKAARYVYQPQYIQEMTNEEWKALLKKTDVGIKEGREASRLHKEKMEKLAEEKNVDRKSHLQEMLNGSEKKYVPYSGMADEYGVIEYNGVVFQCDYEAGALCLGDMTNEKNVLTIPLSEGGCLKVNRDNIEQLSKAIGMFSPEDVNRILRAIAQDAKVRQVKQELDEDSESIGDSATKHLDEEAGVSDEVEEEEYWSDEKKREMAR